MEAIQGIDFGFLFSFHFTSSGRSRRCHADARCGAPDGYDRCGALDECGRCEGERRYDADGRAPNDDRRDVRSDGDAHNGVDNGRLRS